MDLSGTKFEALANKQVSQTKSGDWAYWDRLSEAEYRAVESFIDATPRRVLDLGCGLGRAAVHFAKYIPSPPTRYYLADSNGTHEQWGWNPTPGFTNDMQLTWDFLDTYGVTDFKLIDLAKDELPSGIDNTPVDLVISFLAVGFHYPLEQWLDTLYSNILAPCGIMAVGIRRNTLTPKDMEALHIRFANVIVIPLDCDLTKEDVLILKGPK